MGIPFNLSCENCNPLSCLHFSCNVATFLGICLGQMPPFLTSGEENGEFIQTVTYSSSIQSPTVIGFDHLVSLYNKTGFTVNSAHSPKLSHLLIGATVTTIFCQHIMMSHCVILLAKIQRETINVNIGGHFNQEIS